MRITTVGTDYVITVGWLIALLILILAIVFAATGQLDLKLAGLIGGVALARLT
jgi:hypothetical protein